MIGARTILRTRDSSEVRSSSWSGVTKGGQRTVLTYSSPQREAVLRLCGWSGDKVVSLSPAGDHLASCAHKAAVAIFRLDIRRAVKELQVRELVSDWSV